MNISLDQTIQNFASVQLFGRLPKTAGDAPQPTATGASPAPAPQTPPIVYTPLMPKTLAGGQDQASKFLSGSYTPSYTKTGPEIDQGVREKWVATKPADNTDAAYQAWRATDEGKSAVQSAHAAHRSAFEAKEIEAFTAPLQNFAKAGRNAFSDRQVFDTTARSAAAILTASLGEQANASMYGASAASAASEQLPQLLRQLGSDSWTPEQRKTFVDTVTDNMQAALVMRNSEAAKLMVQNAGTDIDTALGGLKSSMFVNAEQAARIDQILGLDLSKHLTAAADGKVKDVKTATAALMAQNPETGGWLEALTSSWQQWLLPAGLLMMFVADGEIPKIIGGLAALAGVNNIAMRYQTLTSQNDPEALRIQKEVVASLTAKDKDGKPTPFADAEARLKAFSDAGGDPARLRQALGDFRVVVGVMGQGFIEEKARQAADNAVGWATGAKQSAPQGVVGNTLDAVARNGGQAVSGALGNAGNWVQNQISSLWPGNKK